MQTLSDTDSDLVSNWYGPTELRPFYKQLILGDLVEFDRSTFSHWAVYVGRQLGDDYQVLKHAIVHRTSPENTFFSCSSSSASFESHGVIELESLDRVLGQSDSRVRINNSLDCRFEPYSPEEIVQRALQMLESCNNVPLLYSTLTNNCEHFANECRYGHHISLQVESIRQGVLAIYEVSRITRNIISAFIECPPALFDFLMGLEISAIFAGVSLNGDDEQEIDWRILL